MMFIMLIIITLFIMLFIIITLFIMLFIIIMLNFMCIVRRHHHDQAEAIDRYEIACALCRLLREEDNININSVRGIAVCGGQFDVIDMERQLLYALCQTLLSQDLLHRCLHCLQMLMRLCVNR